MHMSKIDLRRVNGKRESLLIQTHGVKKVGVETSTDGRIEIRRFIAQDNPNKTKSNQMGLQWIRKSVLNEYFVTF